MLFPLVIVAASAVSPVAKVVELLQGMESKVEADSLTESTLYEDFLKWSQQEQSNSRETITETSNEVSDAEAFLEEQTVFRDDLSAEVETVIGEISRIEADLANTTAVRAKDRKEFEIADEDRANALRQVGLAIETMQKSSSSFLQQSVVARLRDQAVTRSGVVADLLARAGDKADVLNILRSLEDETSKDRDAGLTEEQKDQNNFELQKESMDTELSSVNQLKADKQRQISASEQASAQKTTELANSKKVLAETKEYLSNLKVEFQQKTSEYKAANGLRSDELTAIQEAVAILTSARAMSVFSSELSIKAPKLSQLKLPASIVSLMQVQATVRRAGARGPFDKVKTMIGGMIDKLSKEASDAAGHHAFCEEEMGKTKKSLSTKKHEVTKLSARLEAREASIEEHETRKAEITKQTGEMGAAVAEATTIRLDEKAQSEKAIAEYGDAVTIIGQATQVLQDVFDEKGTDGNQIIGILEVALSDFSKLKLEAETQESAAKADFKKLTQESKIRGAALASELESVSRMSLETQSDQQHLIRELESVKTEVAAVEDYWTKLKPQCTVKTPSHEERAERREKQIDGLNNALGVLAGEAIR